MRELPNILTENKKLSILNKWASLNGMQNILLVENNKMIYNYKDILVKYFNTQNGNLIRIIRGYITTQIMLH